MAPTLSTYLASVKIRAFKLVSHIFRLTIEEMGKLRKVIKMDGSGIPQIVLMDEKGEHRGVQGSYCWDGICVDYVKPSSRTDIREKLSIRRDATIAFKVVDNISSEKLHVTIFSGDNIVLHEAIETEMKVQVPRGTYLLNVKATWEGQGDVSNVFLVEVL